MPFWNKPKKTVKKNTTNPYEETSTNVAKASAATQPTMGSTRDVSMNSTDPSVTPIIEADKKRDELKMQPVASNPVAKAKQQEEIAKAETAVQEANQTAQEDIQQNPTTVPETTPPATQEQVQSQVQNDMGVNETTSPEEAKQKLMDKLLAEGFVQMNEDGSISVAPYKQLTKNKLSTIGTALSIVLSIATGGVVPALDIGKLTGTAEDEKSARQVYDNFMKQVTDTYGDIFKTETTAEEDPEIAQKAGLYGYTSSGAFAKDMQSLQNTITTMKQSQANAKEYAEFMAGLTAKQLPLAINAARDAGISLDEIARYMKASSGTTFWDDALNKADKVTGIVSSAVNTVKGM